jgi:Protein of unknown function (DUF2971)
LHACLQQRESLVIRRRRGKIVSEFVPDFERLVNRLRGDWFKMNKALALEQPLYHYTDSGGLVGILESQTLRATDARYLNDALEIEHGCRLVQRVLEEKWSSLPRRERRGITPAVTLFLEMAVTDRLFDPYEPGRFAFVTCFCEEGNLLSQWRTYADRGAGYSIGFSWGGLFNNTRSAIDQPLCKVLYEEEQQLTLIRELVEAICATLKVVADRTNVAVNHALATEAIHALRIVLMDYLPCFKHRSFQEEREWRIVQNCDVYDDYVVVQTYDGYKGQNLGRLKFRPAAGTIAPFVELEIKFPHQPFWNRLPIVSVTHGPTQHPTLAKVSLRMLLERCGYPVMVLGHEDDAVRILGSDVPLRV